LTSLSTPATDGLILIVDDVPQNLQVLRSTLQKAHYRIAAANNGEVALRYLQKNIPDLILLDVMMPVLNGFEVCRQIKAQEHLKDIPVIFLTARTEKEDVITGFEAGGVDYITKPFNMSELMSRVKTHISLKNARDTILKMNESLIALNEEKTELMHIASHDLKNPLTAILMHAQSLKDLNASDSGAFESGEAILRSGSKMLDIITNLLDMQRLEAGKEDSTPELIDVIELVSQVLKEHQAHAQKKQIHLEWNPQNELFFTESNWRLLQQILDNLLSNALKYAPPKGHVTVSVQLGARETLNLSIQDNGPGFTAKDRERMFQKFARLSARPTADEDSTGLGLSIVKRLCELLSIDIALETQPGEGSCFTLILPRKVFDMEAAERAFTSL
jgi:two-component system, sensor histidine kinase and response regulator